MSVYAIVNSNDTVENIIVGDDRDFIHAFFSGYTVVEADDASGYPHIGGDLLDGRFRPPRPYPSWVWSGDEWTAPVSYPTDGSTHLWDEEQGAWIKVVLEPEPAPEA